MKEEFRDITGYEGLYQASDLGRIKSLERKVKTKNGYRIVREKILKTSKGKRLIQYKYLDREIRYL